MPWKERSIVEEHMRFVLRLKDGEGMSSLCRSEAKTLDRRSGRIRRRV
jgi:hypothetical protein